MAKNIQIIPASGSVEFDNGDGSKIIYTITGSKVVVTNNRDEVITEYISGSTPQMNVGNDATFILPTQAGAPSDPATGRILFDSNINSIVLGDSATGKVTLQGPKGIQGPHGPIGETAPIGPRGPIGPIGTTGPQGPIGPRGPIGPAGADAPGGVSQVVDVAANDGVTHQFTYTSGVLTNYSTI